MPAGTVAVVGQGYVGLPLAVLAVRAGHEVVGYDVDDARVAALREGRSYVDDVTGPDLAEVLATGRFRASADEVDLAGFDVAVVSVPTPLRDGAPDLGHVTSAARALSAHLRPGCLVVLESTTYPGTTEEVFVPALEEGTDLRAGRDFHVGYSPERIDPSNPTWRLENTPKIVSGIDGPSLEAVAAFYSQLVERIVPVEGTREAELAKLLENTFRHVNIALVNELAMYAGTLGVNIWSVVDAAATKPFGFMRFTPGPGVGGHCLPVDPSYLSWRVQRSSHHQFRFVEVANDINDHMPDYVVSRVAAHLNRRRLAINGTRVLLVGLTYKRNSGDPRQSPALDVARGLLRQGAELTAVDPLIDPAAVPAGVTLVDGGEDDVAGADLVVVLTDHDDVDWALVEKHADRVLDTRNRVAGEAVDRL